MDVLCTDLEDCSNEPVNELRASGLRRAACVFNGVVQGLSQLHTVLSGRWPQSVPVRQCAAISSMFQSPAAVAAAASRQLPDCTVGSVFTNIDDPSHLYGLSGPR
eukprot:g967.t1